MTDHPPENRPAARTCIVCGENFAPELVDSSGRCSACRQGAEQFIENFSTSLGRWASSLKAGPTDSKAAATSGSWKKFSFTRLVLILVLIVVGYYAYSFVANYHLIQTQWFLDHGHIEKAERHLKKAVESHQQDPNLRFVLGNLYYQQGKLESAVEAFRATIELDSLHAGALNNLAWVFAQQNTRLEEALTFSKRSLKIDPDNPFYLDTIAEIYFLKKDYYRAFTYMRKAVEQNPPNIEYYRRRLEIIRHLVYGQGHLIEV